MTMPSVGYTSDYKLTKDTPYLARRSFVSILQKKNDLVINCLFPHVFFIFLQGWSSISTYGTVERLWQTGFPVFHKLQ